MKYVKVIAENGKKHKVLIEDVSWFGQEIIHNKNSQGEFKSFSKKLWVKTDKKYYLDTGYKLSDLRKLFPYYDVSTYPVRKSKKGKIVKATARKYEVLIEGVTKVDNKYHELAKRAIKKHTLFVLHTSILYYITDTFFRNMNDLEYLYYDAEKQYLYKTGIYALEGTKKEDLLKFKNNMNAKEKTS